MKFRIIFLLGLITCLTLLAERSNDIEPTLIINTSLKVKKPKNLRYSTSPLQKSSEPIPSLKGLRSLRASASSQFSENGLLEIIKGIPSSTSIIIVDLRQESHGFIDGSAISWYGSYNWANLGLTYEAVLADENRRLNELQQTGSIRIIHNGQTVALPFTRAQTEEELVSSYGCNYLRIPVADHRRPTDEEVDHFVASLKTLPKKSWVHFHCSAGRGRATTFMVLYDIMHNGQDVALDDILLRQALIGGMDFRDRNSRHKWKVPHQQERLAFIEDFYCYWNETEGEMPWSEWSSQL